MIQDQSLTTLVATTDWHLVSRHHYRRPLPKGCTPPDNHLVAVYLTAHDASTVPHFIVFAYDETVAPETSDASGDPHDLTGIDRICTHLATKAGAYQLTIADTLHHDAVAYESLGYMNVDDATAAHPASYTKHLHPTKKEILS